MKKIEIEEKQKEVLYSIFIVILLIFLLLGDQIALRFIKKNPNPNNTVFKEGTKNAYKIDFLQELTMTDIMQKLQAKETFLLLSTRENCETCKLYLPDLQQTLDMHHINGYYIDHKQISSEDEKLLFEYSDELKKHFSYTPYLVFFRDGIVVDEIIGRVEKARIEDFINQNRIIE